MDPIQQLKEQTTSYSAGSPVPQRDSMNYRDLDWNMTREGLDNFTHAVVDMYNGRYDNPTTLTKSQIAEAVGIRQGTLDTVLRHAEDNGIEVKRSKISDTQREELYQAREADDSTTFRELGARYGISASYAGRIYRQQRDIAQTEQAEEVSETGLVVAQPLELAIADYNPDAETGRPHVIDIQGEVISEEIIRESPAPYRSRTPGWARAAAAVAVVCLGAATLGYAIKNMATSANATPSKAAYGIVENNPITPIPDKTPITGGSTNPPPPNPDPNDGETMYAKAQTLVTTPTPVQPVEKPVADLESTTEVAYETAKDAPKAPGSDYDPSTASLEDIGDVLAGMEQEMDAIEKRYEEPEPVTVEEPETYAKAAQTNAPTATPNPTPIAEAEPTPYQMRGFAHPANGHAYIQTTEGGAWKSDNKHGLELNVADDYITGELGSRIFTETDFEHLPVYDPETKIASNGGEYKQGPKGHGRRWTKSWGPWNLLKGALGIGINPRRNPEVLVKAQMAKEKSSMPPLEIPAEEVPAASLSGTPVDNYISSLNRGDTPLHMLLGEVENEFVHYANTDPEAAAVRLAAYETLMDERTVEWHQHNIKVFGEKGARKAFHRFKGYAEEDLATLLTKDSDPRLISLAQGKLASFQHAEATLTL